MTNELRSPVEDVATAIAATVRAKGWDVSTDRRYIDISGEAHIATLWCKDALQARRLAEMMRGKA